MNDVTRFFATARLAAASAFLLATVGCGSVRVDLPARTATEMTTRIQLVSDRFGVCWPGALDTSAIVDPVNPPGPGQMVGGYANHVRRGQSCHTQLSHAYVAVFRFDLSDISRSIVTNASLTLDSADTNLPIHVTHRYPSGVEEVQRGCALDVEIATEDAFYGAARDRVSSTAITDHRAEVFPGGVRSGLSVTSAVQQWALGNRPNLGFVIRPKPGAIAKNEDSCTAYWSNARLSITVVRPDGD